MKRILCWSTTAFVLATAAAGGAQSAPAPGERLRILPENTRYFEYKGKPLVAFGHQAGTSPVPVPASLSASTFDKAARAGNHFYLAAHPTWVRATFEQLYAKIKDPDHWQQVRDICRWAYERDVLVTLFHWSYKWNYAQQDWSGSDMIYDLGSSEWNRVVTSDGKTKLDLQKLLIERSVAATWDFPNVIYNFMWEYNVRRARDPEGKFHRWWVDEVKRRGAAVNSGRTHLFSIVYGGTAPSTNNADFVAEEDGNGFWKSGSSPGRILNEYKVPGMYLASDYVYGDQTAVGPTQLREMIRAGFHPAETWVSATSDGLNYYLQARWYLENIRTWGDEPGDEVQNVPVYRASGRPTLANVSGYTAGAKVNGSTIDFALVYKDPDGDPPAQAEVWVDRNGDGRFDPDPAAGERIAMKASGTSYASGVTYTAPGISAKGPAVAYVFRFADRHWWPPAAGGLVPANNAGISYRHWTITLPDEGTSLPGSVVITNTSPSRYVWDLLDLGKLQYIDRSFTFGSAPASYLGLQYLRTANDDKGSTGNIFLTFDVDMDVTIYVAHDDRLSSRPGWMSEFVDTGADLVSGAGTFRLWSRDYVAGTVSLGGNVDVAPSDGGYSMYSVVVRAKTGGGGETGAAIGGAGEAGGATNEGGSDGRNGNRGINDKVCGALGLEALLVLALAALARKTKLPGSFV